MQNRRGNANGDMAAHHGEQSKDLARRARRFAVEIPIRYRETGRTAWQEGTTLNISTSGVLFRSAKALKTDTPLDIAFVLPVVIPGETPGEIRCRGTVIRGVPGSGSDGAPMLGVAIANRRFVHQPQDESQKRVKGAGA